MKEYCPNCHKKVETEKVLDKELNKKKIKCADCGYVLRLEESIKDRLIRFILTETTIEELKSNLPDVNVSWEGKVYKGKLQPKGDLVSVTLYDVPGTKFEYSWDTVLKAINSDTDLVA
jgi:hypothetical protein